MSKLTLIPKRDQIIARLIDMGKTEGGLHLPRSEMRGVSVLARVESVGPDVTSCKPGDIILPRAIGHAWLRGGLIHWAVIDDKEVLCEVQGLDPETIIYDDEHSRRVDAAAEGNGDSKLVTP
jgi:hypothetical protein